ncbi:bifunctional diaminohydroxyphosphoribosylaminopyrimidine deaminase/5-amino-6-(5-phosphoribosylamino)uracil reductase RibD [Inquilinus sp. Marseille-Q2685]|uniref:bifunctional diaminohydroxyphosphoribosylaminopyrimidine deaminase/5-amino-6-(5-phosphoribosylamino)uracil reductase RibD n=1 Tax=Inquilinus sp. Marseille-Q2685 TaxID=2866581 RepID=UPI001CE47393|nr:bifunctional diaminohydroxyphosphoribosylaminopyrimidine deaminase/5-amino-6-(5-phosphoribosylamino)uracil reductase RibD [Inquilinus sp. Marseille-Q2685]
MTLPAGFSLRPGFGFGGVFRDTLPEALRDAAPPARTTGDDEAWMLETLRTAMTHNGLSDPNPVVGCVIVRDGRVVSRGATERIGERHAERVAVEAVADRSAFRGATAYVTLEPCSHHGRQPPCADLLASLGLARCVAALRDPFPLVDGAGLARLQAAGVDVSLGTLAPEAAAWHAPFLLRQRLDRPLVAAKWAQTLDGQLAFDDGAERWLTGKAARAHTHWLRQKYDAILVGAGTVLADDPALTVRDAAGDRHRHPLRLVYDPNGRALAALPQRLDRWKAGLLSADAPTVFLLGRAAARQAGAVEAMLPPSAAMLALPDGPPVDALFDTLAGPAVVARLGRPVGSVMVEGGPRLLGLLLEAGRVDLAHVFIAPAIGGGERNRIAFPGSAAATRDWRPIATAALGPDLLAEYVSPAVAAHLARLVDASVIESPLRHG